jgi:hypothetical protein
MVIMEVWVTVLTERFAGVKRAVLFGGRPEVENTTVPPATVAGPRAIGMVIAWPAGTGGSAADDAGATVKFGTTTVCTTIGDVLAAKLALAT